MQEAGIVRTQPPNVKARWGGFALLVMVLALAVSLVAPATVEKAYASEVDSFAARDSYTTSYSIWFVWCEDEATGIFCCTTGGTTDISVGDTITIDGTTYTVTSRTQERDYKGIKFNYFCNTACTDGVLYGKKGNVSDNFYTTTGIYGANMDPAEIKHIIFHDSFQYVPINNIAGWFSGCSSLTDIVGLNYLFEALENGNTHNLSGSYRSAVAIDTLSYTFSGCSSLKSVDLSGINILESADVSYAFSGCSSLETIYVDDDWPVTSGSDESMFAGCTSLTGAAGHVCDGATYIDSSYAHVDVCTDPGYLTYASGTTGAANYEDGHTYASDTEPEWQWVETDDGFIATAIFQCINEGEDVSHYSDADIDNLQYSEDLYLWADGEVTSDNLMTSGVHRYISIATVEVDEDNENNVAATVDEEGKQYYIATVTYDSDGDGKAETYTNSDAYKTLDALGYYTIVFDTNGGDTQDSELAPATDTFTLPGSDDVTYAHHTLTGWATSASGIEDDDTVYSVTTSTTTDSEGTEIITEDELSANLADLIQYADDNKVITLYAQWKANIYTVNFDANGGSGTMSSIYFDAEGNVYTYNSESDSYSVSASASYTLPECTFTAPDDNSSFSGWDINYYDSSATGSTYSDTISRATASYAVAVSSQASLSNLLELAVYSTVGTDNVQTHLSEDGDSITLYAVWATDKISLVYGSNMEDYVTLSYTDADSNEVTAGLPWREVVKTSDSSAVATTVTVTPATGYHIEYITTGSVSSEEKPTDGVEAVTDSDGNETGAYTITPQKVDTDGDGTADAYETTYYYVIVAANTYTLIYEDGVDSEEIEVPESQSVTYGKEVTLGSAPERNGYTFTGWVLTDEDGNSVTYSASKTVLVSSLVGSAASGADLTLTASWEAKKTIGTTTSDEGDETDSTNTADVSIYTDTQTYYYDGTSKEFEIIVPSSDADSIDTSNFTVIYYYDADNFDPVSPVDVGTYTVVITYPEDSTYAEFKTTIEGGLVINPTTLTTEHNKGGTDGYLVVTVDVDDDGTVTVTDEDGNELEEGTDYTVTYYYTDENGNEVKVEDPTDPGTYTVVITPIGNYTGNDDGPITGEFTIAAATDISNARLSIDPDTVVYTGPAQEPTIAVTLGEGEDAVSLTQYTDYTVAYYYTTTDDDGNVVIVTDDDGNQQALDEDAPSEVGTYMVVITGTGSYTGTLQGTFTIMPITVTENTDSNSSDSGTDTDGDENSDGSSNTSSGTFAVTVKLSEDTFTYNGKKQVPEVTVTDKDGNTLTEGTDYTITYKDSSGNEVTDPTDPDSYTLVITFIGSYDGTITKTFTITANSKTVGSDYTVEYGATIDMSVTVSKATSTSEEEESADSTNSTESTDDSSTTGTDESTSNEENSDSKEGASAEEGTSTGEGTSNSDESAGASNSDETSSDTASGESSEESNSTLDAQSVNDVVAQASTSIANAVFGYVSDLFASAVAFADDESDETQADTVTFTYNGTNLGSAVALTYDDTNTNADYIGTATITYDTTTNIVPVGETVTILATYSGTDNVKGSDSVQTLTLTITQGSVTVSVDESGTVTITDNSGNPVTYDEDDLIYNYYDEDGNELTEKPTAPGTYYYTITYPGSDYYQAGTSEKIKFVIEDTDSSTTTAEGDDEESSTTTTTTTATSTSSSSNSSDNGSSGSGSTSQTSDAFGLVGVAAVVLVALAAAIGAIAYYRRVKE